MCNYKDVNKIYDKRLGQDWRQEAKISDSYVEIKDELIKMLSDFDTMCDRHLGRVNIANHLFELSPSDSQPIHSAPCGAGPNAIDSKSTRSTRCLPKELSDRLRPNGRH